MLPPVVGAAGGGGGSLAARRAPPSLAEEALSSHALPSPTLRALRAAAGCPKDQVIGNGRTERVFSHRDG